jgi:hypothetical protein
MNYRDQLTQELVSSYYESFNRAVDSIGPAYRPSNLILRDEFVNGLKPTAFSDDVYTETRNNCDDYTQAFQITLRMIGHVLEARRQEASWHTSRETTSPRNYHSQKFEKNKNFEKNKRSDKSDSYRKRPHTDDKSVGSGKKKDKSNITCFKCLQKGHFATECKNERHPDANKVSKKDKKERDAKKSDKDKKNNKKDGTSELQCKLFTVSDKSNLNFFLFV